MRFEFTQGNPILTKTVQQGGLGMTAAEAVNVRRWQTSSKYVFEFHSGMHGDPCVYVNDAKKPTGGNVPCIWLQGAKQFQWRGESSIKDSDDAEAVVRANQALFLRFYNAYTS